MFECNKLVGADFFKRIGVSDNPTLEQIQAQLRAVDAYRLLGVAQNASLDEIKKAYRKLILQFHSDRYCQHQAAVCNDYETNEIKALADAVTIALNEGYKALRRSHQTFTHQPDERTTEASKGPINLTHILFPARPPLVDKPSAREFITKIHQEITHAVTSCGDSAENATIKQAMSNLANQILEYERLHLPDLERLSDQSQSDGALSQAVSKKVYRNGVLHSQFHVFLLECLDEVNVAKQSIPAAQSKSTCQIAMDFLRFLIEKTLRMMHYNFEPVYPGGVYNGLFKTASKEATKAVDKIESNLASEIKEAVWVSENMTDRNSCTSRALWR